MWRAAPDFPPPGGIQVVGVPRATLLVNGSGSGGKLFLELVDRKAGEVLGNQEVPVRFDGVSARRQRFDVDLTAVAHWLAPGHHLDLQVATGTTQYTPSRAGGVVGVTVTVDVPVHSR